MVNIIKKESNSFVFITTDCLAFIYLIHIREKNILMILY